MMLTERDRIYLPKSVHWEQEGGHLFLDPESPHWVAVDQRGAELMAWIAEDASLGELMRRYAEQFRVDSAKAWLHVHDFVRALLRVGFASRAPIELVPYLGRSAYAQPTKLRELWFHTNNICNLACSHCLVGSAPWVQDWGLPTEVVKQVVDEAVELGVERFYFTGGEPFMRKDIFELIRHITETKGGELIILTNATLFKGERAEATKHLNRERVRFQVSVDGASPETNDRIRGNGSFQTAIAGMQFLASEGFDVSMTTVVTRANLQELSEITKLVHRYGVRTQHLMWLHRRGRILEESDDPIPPIEALIEATRHVRRVSQELGVALDNWESIKHRVNGRPGVKYDLGNACWDSVCVYSDGTVYPSAATANIQALTLGALNGPGSLREVWRRSPIAEVFRQASVARKAHLASDPFRYLTGGGDLEHAFWFNVNGDMNSRAMAVERLREILAGPDPYYPLYVALMQDAMWEWAKEKAAAVNRRSGYDVPRVLHAMGDGAIHCATDDLAVSGEIDVRTLHSNCVLAFDVDKPRKLVREYYAEAAETPKAELCCPTKFDDSLISHIPREVVERFYGCGSPVSMGHLQPGETMVDLGSGAGIDCFIAAKLVGPTGQVIGVDMTDQMLEVAHRNRPIVAANLGYDIVEFRKGYLESVPVESKSVDVVTSNCVINLSPDKPKVFTEIWRILKDHGRTVIADIVSNRPVPAHLKVNPELWGECIVGALTEEEFLARLEEAGFYGLAILKKAHWKTVEGFDFYSVTVQGYKFEKSAAAPGERPQGVPSTGEGASSSRSQSTGCQFIGQQTVYLGPMKAIVDEEGHLFPRNVAVEVCTDTAAKLSKPPYAGSFVILKPDVQRVEMQGQSQPKADPPVAAPLGTVPAAGCGPGCC